ncbi:MAG: esterase-like activity of phytase family protein, partial [Archangium sp.]|nr:esterase-like activity of phytase family protein [Archangium sp.]
MRWLLMLCLAGCSTKSVRPEAQGPRRALLTGRAVLSANTFVDGPHSGSCVEGGPFSSQPVQGFSSLQLTPNGFLSISDNGYGVPETSADFLLRAWKLEPDLTTGVLKATTLFVLSDPSRRLNWPIVNENTTTRLLTGADLDPESFVRVADGTFWFGDEHGPFLVHVDDQGRVLEPPFEVPIDGGALLGADSPFLRTNLMLRSAEALKVATGTRTLSPDHRWLTSVDQVKALHTAGFRVVPWTVNEPARID